MNNDIKKIEDSINDIIQKNEDAIKGYKKAAENADQIGLKNYFLTKSEERRNFLIGLKASVPALETRDEIDGSTTGAVHRAWMDTKAFFSADNDESMLEEAIRGDKAAVEEYNEVLGDTGLPIEAAKIIREQRDWIVKDLNKIKRLEDVR
ncbi:ferritin-like domain-containing protein [Allomuricauda sp. F6463D]|uniref:ferritin-like domain-containing protein n=1 Tax=Allomuricauda sp. F6463D TaxID=2926409 RepID=UPI001FF41456|nr:PA2169 family four-helix-bundle protein [Muricauda sp. F6463D]MCK0159168.1 PA2169 family four-helix-bundle protein [Muricauda sp. F6463D]